MRPTDFQQFIADEGYIPAPDVAKKRMALQKAAKRGDGAAQCSLGVMCCHGFGVPQNLTEAVTWFRKAAEQGDVDAQRTLD
jgi:TPR repeat protein